MEFTRAAAASAALHALALTLAAAMGPPAPRIEFVQGAEAIRLESQQASQAINLLAAPEALDEPPPEEVALLRPTPPETRPQPREPVVPQPTRPAPLRRQALSESDPLAASNRLPAAPPAPPAGLLEPRVTAPSARPVAEALPIAALSETPQSRATANEPCDVPDAPSPPAPVAAVPAPNTPLTRTERIAETDAQPPHFDLTAVESPVAPLDSVRAKEVERKPQETPPVEPVAASPVAPLERADVGKNQVTASSAAAVEIPDTTEGSERKPRGLPTNRPPEYPHAAWLQRVQGVVLLRIVIRPDGVVRESSIAKTSGSRALDAAALSASRRWRYASRPGASEDYVDLLPMRFVIRGGKL
ncbi:MAG TPA: TonB family protein [Pirellulales bacterium]